MQETKNPFHASEAAFTDPETKVETVAIAHSPPRPTGPSGKPSVDRFTVSPHTMRAVLSRGS